MDQVFFLQRYRPQQEGACLRLAEASDAARHRAVVMIGC